MSSSQVSPVKHVTHSEKMKVGCVEQCLIDCRTLTPMQLRRRYPAEVSSHRNMLQRKQKRGFVHPDFYDFRDFLRHIGPRPCRGATLDRINNNDPEYAPGKVRWADKRTQNGNKGDTLLFHYARTGESYTVSRLALIQQVAPGTIRRRRRLGWTDDEIVEGKRAAKPDYVTPKSTRYTASPTRTTPATCPPKQAITDAERQFRANAAEAEQHRKETGEEYCLAPLWMINEAAAECSVSVPPLSQEAYDRKFAQWWAVWWPHVCYDRLPDEAKETLGRLDVGLFAKLRETQEETDIAALYRYFVKVNWKPEPKRFRSLDNSAFSQTEPGCKDEKSSGLSGDTQETVGAVLQAQGDTNDIPATILLYMTRQRFTLQ